MSYVLEANSAGSPPSPSGKIESHSGGMTHLPMFAAMMALLLAAPSFALASWALAADHPAVLFYAFPVIAAEIVVIVAAIAAGLDIRAAFMRLHPLTRIGAGVWLVAVLFADLVAAPVRAAAVPLLFTTLIHASFALALWGLITSGWASRQRTFLYCAAAGAGLFGLIFTAIILAELNDPTFNWVGVGVGITNIRQLGFYGIALVGIMAGLAGSACGWRKALAAIAIAFGFWLTILSGSRVAFTAAILAGVVIGILSAKERRASIATLIILALAAAIPASYLLVPHESWGFDRIIERSLSGDSVEQYASGRLAIWQETWPAILQSPLVGHGEGQFRSQIAAAGNGLNHPHNAILQFLYQWGAIGTLAVALMLATTAGKLRATMQRRQRSSTELASIGALTGLLAMAMLEGSLYHVYPVMIVVLCLVTLNAAATPSSQTAPRGEGTLGTALGK